MNLIDTVKNLKNGKLLLNTTEPLEHENSDFSYKMDRIKNSVVDCNNVQDSHQKVINTTQEINDTHLTVMESNDQTNNSHQ